MNDIQSYISPSAAEYIRNEIDRCSGNEIFLCGYTDENGIVTDVDVLARGNELSVPAIIDFLSPDNVVIHNHPSGLLEPSFDDINIASYLGNLGIGVYIINNDVSDIYIVVEKHVEEEKTLLDTEKLADLLKPGGIVSQKLSNYEFREGQIEMMKNIVNVFNKNKIQIIEAGTGIGKTLAYLIPAIYWSVNNKERCVVSTNTINLQEQIIYKDIPFLQEVLDIDFKAVLIKGRNNYVCLRKVEAEEREMPTLVLPEEKEELKSLIDWARRTSSGDKSELTMIPKAESWEKVCCESDTCLRAKCKYYEICFLVKARREAAVSNILVVNHYLLFADLHVRSQSGQFSDIAVIPPYPRIIIDEAHHTEEVATEYFGIVVSLGGTIKLLGRIYSERKTGGARGVISYLRTKLIINNRGKLREKITPIISDIEGHVIPQKNELVALAEDIFLLISKLIPENNNGKAIENRKRRINEDIKNLDVWKNKIIPELYNFQKLLKKFSKYLKELKKSIDSLQHRVYKDLEHRAIELQALYRRIDDLNEKIQNIFVLEESDRVKWIETEELTRGKRIAAHSVPLNISSELENTLFKYFKTVLLTSATLTVNKSFDFMKKRIGLSAVLTDRYAESIIPSPFDYLNQVMVGIPLNLPSPDDNNFVERATEVIFRSVSLSKGRAFILFTSYKMLNESFAKLEEPFMKNLNIVSLKQGEYTRTYLLDYFRRDTSSVLFATDSFWEGVDVEGSSLESIVIVKLPFRVPTDPVIEARAEDIERIGGNSFNEYSLPLAVIKFKQGFGRLIRRKTDRGFILILDKRIIKKYYGKIFLNSLPPCKITSGNINEVFEKLKKFYKI